MFGHKKAKRQQQHTPSQPANQFALAAARAIVPPRSQTPLSAAAAAAALHASPKQVTSPGSLVTRRMERRGSISSITSAPPGFSSIPGRRGSDASMTERIGWLRGSDEHGTSSSSRPGSRQRPMSRDVVTSPTRGLGKRTSIEDHGIHATTQAKTLGQLESKHTPKAGKAAPKSAAKSGTKAPKATREVYEEEPVREVRKAAPKARKAASRPKTSPEPTARPAALVAAVAVATSKKSQPKAAPKPKAKPKPVEPVYESESEEEEEEEEEEERPRRARRVYSDSESEEEEEIEEPPPPPASLKKSLRSRPVEPIDDGSVHLKKSLRSTPTESAARAPVKKKNIQAQTHSDTQGGMLSRGTMRTTVREDMEPVVAETRERHRQPARTAYPSALQESVYAPKPQPAAASSGPSDAVKALALQIMREQQAKAAGKPVLLESRRARRRAAAAAEEDSDEDMEPDTRVDEEERFAAEHEEHQEEDKQIYKRHQYAGSVNSITSFTSLESIPEEAGEHVSADGKKKKKKRSVPESVIIPGKDGVPALPSSPILEMERMRFSQVSASEPSKRNTASPEPSKRKVASPEPPKRQSLERRRTLEKLTGETMAPAQPPTVGTITTRDIAAEDLKGSPPSSATLTEDVNQSVVIHTIPPTPPAFSEKINSPPRLFDADSSEDDAKHVAKANGSALKPKKTSPPPRENTHSPRTMKRHSPPPRSVSPAKSALKHTQHHEGSDRSSILSAEDGSVGGHASSGKRKSARVSFSEDPSVVEMDDDSYHYRPIHSALDKVTEKKGPSKGVGAVSFSSVSRTRVERTPSPEPSSLAAAHAATHTVSPPAEHSSDHRLGGLLGLIKGKKKDGRHSPVPEKRGSRDPLAPEVISMSPAPSISDDELESEPETLAPQVEVAKAIPIVATTATPPLAMSTPPPTTTSPPALVAIPPPPPEQPKTAQIAAGHTPPAVDVKPIFPPTTANTSAPIAENIAQGRPIGVFKEDSGEDEDHFSDAYEDLDHVVLSATGSGAVIGVTTAHVNNQAATASAEAQPVAVVDNVVLPSIEEVADQSVTITTTPETLQPQVVGGLLPEEVITDDQEQAHMIHSPKPIKPVSPKLISAGLASSPSPPVARSAIAPAPAPTTNGTSKPAAAKTTPKTTTKTTTKTTKTSKAAAKPKSELAESKFAPKPKQKKAAPAPAPVPVPVPPPAHTAARKLSKSKHTSAPIPAPAPQRTPQRRLSIDSDDSASSFQRENPHRRARRSQGFSMRMSMRDSTGRVPPSSIASHQESAPAASRFAEPSPTTRFESGFRTGRTMGTGGPRRREYSPDSSDDDRAKMTSLRTSAKPEKKRSGFLGKSTLRSSNVPEKAAGRPHSSLGFTPKASANTGRSMLGGFRSRFEDSSDDEDMQLSPGSRAPPVAAYRPLTPDSSDEEELAQTNGNKAHHGGLQDSIHAPPAGIFVPGQNYDFATEISADIAPRKRWWSFGSRRKSSTGSRPVSRANSIMSTAPSFAPSAVPATPKPGIDRRMSDDPEHLVSPMTTTAQRNQMKKFRRLSSGSVNSVSSNRTWSQSLGTSTLVGSPGGVSSGNRNLTHGRLEELQEEDEEEYGLNSDPVDNGNTVNGNGKAQTVEPNGGVYGTPKAAKKKKFRGLRKMFGIDD